MKEPCANIGENLTITKITEGRKVISLEFSDGSVITMSLNNYLANGYFYVGKTIKEEQLRRVREFARLETGRNYVANLLSRGNYTSRELVMKLQHVKHVSGPDAVSIVSEYIGSGSVDDREFALRYIEELNARGLTKEACRERLLKRLVAAELVEELLSDYVENEDALSNLIENCFNRYRHKSYRAKIFAVKNYLLNHGFTLDRTEELINNYLSTNGGRDDETENRLLVQAADSYYYRLRNRYDVFEVKERLVRHLLLRGFNYDDIMSLIKGDRYEFD